MIWSVFIFLCGVLVAQEYPDIPKIRPKIQQLINKFTQNNE